MVSFSREELRIVQSSIETVVGAVSLVESLSAMGATCGVGVVCTVASAGACAVPAGLVLTEEGAEAIGAAGMTAHGILMMAKLKRNPVGRSSSAQYLAQTKDNIELLENAGYDIHDLKGGAYASKNDHYKDKLAIYYKNEKVELSPKKIWGLI